MKKLGLHVLLSALLLVAMVGCAPEEDQQDTTAPQQQQETTPTQPGLDDDQQQDQEQEYSVELQEIGNSGVSGEGTVTVTGNQVRVMVDVEGLEGNQAYPIIIHGGQIEGAQPGMPGQQDQQPGQDTTPGAPGQQDQQQPGQQDQQQPGMPGQQDQQQPGQETTPGAPGQDNGLGQQDNGDMQAGDISGPMLVLLPFPEANQDGTLTFEGTFDDVEMDDLQNLSMTVFGVAENGEIDITQPAASGQFQQAQDNGMNGLGQPGQETEPGQETTPGAPGGMNGQDGQNGLGGPGTGNGGTGGGTTEP